MLGLGIDTGGTCTDAVIFDMDESEVLSVGKTATTKEKLEIGIEEAIKMLDADLLKKVGFVSLSTTLATNACVENKGSQVKLLLIGADKKVLKSYYKDYGFESLDDIRVIDGIPDGGYVEGVPADWEALYDMIDDFSDALAIGIVQANAQRDNIFELKAKEILSDFYDVPIVCGSSLFSELNVIRRGAGTYLNVRLIPIINSFLSAVKNVLSKYDITAPVYIVRSDGSLMSEEYALEHPVETLLCGPAASALGGGWLSKCKDAVVVDIGGTTTDIALLKNGVALTVDGGIKINGWKTFVKGMYIDTFGLGGDSLIRCDGKKTELMDYRVMPVCMVASKYPLISKRLQELAEDKFYNSKYPYEGFELVKSDFEKYNLTDIQEDICRSLMNGPLIYEDIEDRYAFENNIGVLEKYGIVMRFGITPTDIMHINGEFSKYNSTAAKAALNILSKKTYLDENVIADMVYKEFEKKLTINIIRVLIESGGDYYKEGIDKDLLKFITMQYDLGKECGMYITDFTSGVPVVGVGGPAHIFMDKVASNLNTYAVMPKHSIVANAIGTLAGQIVVEKSIEITFRSVEGIPGYCVFLDGKPVESEEFDDAIQVSAEYLKEKVNDSAKRRGAKGEIRFEENVEKTTGIFYGSPFVVGGRVSVRGYAGIN